MIVEYHVDTFPAGSTTTDFLPLAIPMKTGTFVFRRDFPDRYKGAMETLMRNFAKVVRQHHTDCEIAPWRSATLEIVPPDPIYPKWSCSRAPEPQSYEAIVAQAHGPTQTVMPCRPTPVPPSPTPCRSGPTPTSGWSASNWNSATSQSSTQQKCCAARSVAG